MKTTRYTRNVGHWSLRISSLILVILLGGGSTLASLCQNLCSEARAADQLADTAQPASGHHHGAPAPQPESSPSSASTHDHDGMRADASALLTQVDGLMALSCTTNCCTGLLRPRTSLTADRADTGLLLRPLADSMLSMASIPEPGLETLHFRASSPPGASFRSNSVVVLRI